MDSSADSYATARVSFAMTSFGIPLTRKRVYTTTISSINEPFLQLSFLESYSHYWTIPSYIIHVLKKYF